MANNVVYFLFVTTTMLVTMTNATTYIVGDVSGWRTGINYASWTSKKSFKVGDLLDFYYDATQHDVVQVSKADYETCSSSNPLTSDNSGYSTLTLKDLETVYIVCGTQGHCQQGMKMQVNIVGYASSGYKFKSIGYFVVVFCLMILAVI